MDFATTIFYIVLSLSLVLGVKTSITRSYFIKINSKSKKYVSINFGYFLLVSLLIFFAVFRYVYYGYGGTDAYTYVKEFQEIKGTFSDYLKMERYLKFWNYSESLFKALTLFCRNISSDYRIYFLFTYSLIVGGLLTFVYNTYHKKSNFLTLILLFCSYLYSYNVMRGWMSIAICMFALIDIKEHHWKKSLLFIIIATFFHTISLVFVLVWLACWIDFRYPHFFTRGRLIICVLFGNLAFFLGRSLFMMIVMSTKYSYYMDWFNMQMGLLGYIPTFFICVIAIFMYPKFKQEGGFASTAVVILAVDLGLMYCIVYLLGWRIHDYFAPVRMYMLSELYINVPKYFKEKKVIKMLINVFIIALFIQLLQELFQTAAVFPYILDI